MPDNFVYVMGRVTELVGESGLWTEFMYVWTHPDEPGPSLDSLNLAMVGIWDDWITVLSHAPQPGWTQLPTKPGETRLFWSDFSYQGAIKLKPRTIFENLEDSDLAVGAGGNLIVGTKGNNIQALAPLPQPVMSKNPADLNEVDVIGPRWIASDGLTDPARTMGGFTVLDGDLWISRWEFYNTAGRDNLGIICVPNSDLSGSTAPLGGWRVGPRNRTWDWHDIPNLGPNPGEGPATFEIYHANKTHHYIMNMDPTWALRYAPGYDLGGGRVRGAGAFGGAQGPALYAFKSLVNASPGGDLQGIPLLCYPSSSHTWQSDYRNAEKSDFGGANMTWVWTKDGRSCVLFGWSDGHGPNNYGPGPSCNPNKGWKMHPITPSIMLYDTDELGEVANGVKWPWEPQGYEFIYPSEFWRNPIDGYDPNCNNPYFSGITYDPEKQTLYVLQAKAFDPGGGTILAHGCIIHVWSVG